jgi:uncharacterized protein (TIGR02444 family)
MSEGTTRTEATPFWRFSLAYYSRPGVPAVLIKLQDELGIDVNLILLALWLGSERRVLTDERMNDIGARSCSWQMSAVAPLREIRRALKGNAALVAATVAEAFRGKVKALELEAEHLQQDALFALAEDVEPAANISRDEAAKRNLATYARFAGAEFPGEVTGLLLSHFRALTTNA